MIAEAADRAATGAVAAITQQINELIKTPQRLGQHEESLGVEKGEDVVDEHSAVSPSAVAVEARS